MFAFARTHAAQQVLVVVPRLVATVVPDGDVAPAEVLARFPVACLEGR